VKCAVSMLRNIRSVCRAIENLKKQRHSDGMLASSRE
jgi:hypothetical protein